MSTEEITITCDKCSGTFKREQIEVWTRVIAKDSEERDIVEQFYSCPLCGQHYTITVINDDMRKMILRRQQIRKFIKMHIRNRSRESAIRNLQKEDDQMKEKLMKMSAENKEKYKPFTEE